MANFSAITVFKVPTQGSQLGVLSELSRWQSILLTRLLLPCHGCFALPCLLAPLGRSDFQMQVIGVFRLSKIHMRATFGLKEHTVVLSP